MLSKFRQCVSEGQVALANSKPVRLIASRHLSLWRLRLARCSGARGARSEATNKLYTGPFVL